LEGLTASRGGRHIYAAMEGTLSGDVSPAGDDTYRRILVYDRGPIGYQLGKQVGYQVDPGMRIAEAQSYGHDSLLVLEAAWSPETGNLVRLYAVTGLRHAADVTDVPNLGADPSGVVDKQLVADVTACPDLGAPSREHQTNSLMDNYEAMTITHLRGHGGLHKGNGGLSKLVLLSDDNFNPAQFTRVLRLAADLP
ncbi:MAG: esterase-like activity of phytase family protein, partial [Nocardioidaceae bacterium]